MLRVPAVVGAAAGLSNATTAVVAEKVVKLLTAKAQCSWAELHQGQSDPYGRALVAPATCFVTHAWSFALDTSLKVSVPST